MQIRQKPKVNWTDLAPRPNKQWQEPIFHPLLIPKEKVKPKHYAEHQRKYTKPNELATVEGGHELTLAQCNAIKGVFTVARLDDELDEINDLERHGKKHGRLAQALETMAKDHLLELIEMTPFGPDEIRLPQRFYVLCEIPRRDDLRGVKPKINGTAQCTRIEEYFSTEQGKNRLRQLCTTPDFNVTGGWLDMENQFAIFCNREMAMAARKLFLSRSMDVEGIDGSTHQEIKAPFPVYMGAADPRQKVKPPEHRPR